MIDIKLFLLFAEKWFQGMWKMARVKSNRCLLVMGVEGFLENKH